jgi:hypothetical protein
MVSASPDAQTAAIRTRDRAMLLRLADYQSLPDGASRGNIRGNIQIV